MPDRVPSRAWTQLSSGRAFQFNAPTAVDVSTIASSLARQARYNGHTREAYSVAQHACFVSRLVRSPLAAHALHHDSAECVLGDLITPIKTEINSRTGGWLRELEANILAAILRGFGLEPLSEALEAEVKRADEIALCVEVRDLLPPGERTLDLPIPFNIVSHIPRIARCWSADEAEARFLERWAEVKP